jgi:hypothetical protein
MALTPRLREVRKVVLEHAPISATRESSGARRPRLAARSSAEQSGSQKGTATYESWPGLTTRVRPPRVSEHIPRLPPAENPRLFAPLRRHGAGT